MARTSFFSKLLTPLCVLFLFAVAVVVAFLWMYGSQERTYYGAHTNILPSGARNVAGCYLQKREIVLTQEVRDQNTGTHATHTVVAKSGTEPLKFELPK
jgi:hypothetical protein